jgi:penicillin-binding protein 1B
VGQAAWFYFDRPVQELRLPQVALLIALIKGPSYYDPRRHADRALERRNLVIDILLRRGVITPEQAQQAKAAPLGVIARAPKGDSPYPAFLDLVRRQLQRDYREEDLTSEGLRIFTTLDPMVQASAEEALARRLTQLEKDQGMSYGTLEGAVIVTSIEGGEVLAVIGGRDARFAGFNRALDALRPIGSLVKPAVYLAALEHPERYTLATPLNDRPITVRIAGSEAWSPQNYDHRNHGSVPLHKALSNSYNLSTVRLGLSIGVGEVLQTLQKLGVQRPIDPYPSLLLGSPALPPIEVAQIYETLAAGGFHTPLRVIREVLDVRGEPLQRYPLTVSQAFDPGPVFLVNTVLQEVTRRGTGRALSRTLPQGLTVAGKTGTTDELRDSWFAGFTGDHVAVVWVGRDDNQPTGLSGATGALPVWSDVIRAIGSRPLELIQPTNIEFARVDRRSGLLAGDGCPGGDRLPFIAGSKPRRAASCSFESETVIADGPDDAMPLRTPPGGVRETPLGMSRDPQQDTTVGTGDDRVTTTVKKTLNWFKGIFQ